ncbi:MAG: DUF885 domain-containing protein [Halieaceae bacterium]|jgi:uncharacterized protein (DUF885 family)|nr:DUF885 domain-containing protein [Halieaceae bacterium]MBT6126295.1 DUF885 domain-containing protein [Halieaceae bacterium]MBT7719242.1 DUF885 domain-containing protein [Halieaceae bacterium]
MLKIIFGAVLTALLGTALAATAQTAVPAEPHLQAAQTESDRANALFDEIFDRKVARDPVYQTYLGLKTNYGKWSDLSEAGQAANLAHRQADLKLLQDIDTEQLKAETLVSYNLLEQKLLEEIEDYKWRHHNYPVNQMFGEHARIPAFLINQHTISNVSEAEAYISRLNGVHQRLQQVIDQLTIREKEGVIAPSFVLPHVLRDSSNLLVGAPFDGGEPSTLMIDFSSKVAKLDIPALEKARLNEEARLALLNSFQPGYQGLISYLESLQSKTTADAGVWKLPAGEDYYNIRLNRVTTTDFSAEKIHQIGLTEVARIRDEMRVIQAEVGFEGSLGDFMTFMRTDSQFYFANNDEGREQYLQQANVVLAEIDERLDELFLVRPQASLDVKRVEEFRERSAGKAFYQHPAADGSRPGRYYANLYDMSMMPKYQLEALAYHEGLPGHHMQIAIKQELTGLPKFRRFGGVTAYSEGWGLYSELLPKEIGMYQDPYSDFGRLTMELWRAVRLVVDTGMHSKKWTREESIEFYTSNTPNPRIDAVKMVERHAVMPGQATAYKIGMLKILENRSKAQLALGDDFDIREFHDVVLKNGAVPMNLLEAQVDQYIAEKKSSTLEDEA